MEDITHLLAHVEGFASEPGESDEAEHTYSYESLGDVDNIRLLELQPASSAADEVTCSLAVADLSAQPQYEALSYTRGKSDFPRSIRVGNSLLQVTENLFAALIALRDEHQPRKIWIDAVCINQQDLMEKVIQVAKMAAIYKQANTVIIWLGPGSAATESAFACIKTVSDEAGKFGMSRVTGPLYWFREPDFSGAISEAAEIIGRTLIAQTKDTYSRSWFARMWVIQGCFLAQDMVIACGPERLAWADFRNSKVGTVGGHSEVRGVCA